MQQATTVQTSRRHREVTVIRTAALVAALTAALAALLASRPEVPQAPPAAPAAREQALPHAGSRFADEAAYTPTAQEYRLAKLGEDYLPIARATAAPRLPARAFTSPRFADDAAYTLAASEYASLTLGDDYLPLSSAWAVEVAHHSSAGLNSRVLSDELAGAVAFALTTTFALDTAGLTAPLAGPR